jgi:putative redox protein
MSGTLEAAVVVTESGNGPYAQFVTAGRHVLGADEPERLGGRDTGPSPYDFLLAGLGACTAMTMRTYATKHAWHVDHISVDLHHEKVAVPGATTKSDRFERVITLIGELTEEQRAQLLEIADKCPVSLTLRQPSVVISRFS